MFSAPPLGRITSARFYMDWSVAGTSLGLPNRTMLDNDPHPNIVVALVGLPWRFGYWSSLKTKQ